MIRLTVRYDGEVLVPDTPVELPTGVPLQVVIETPSDTVNGDPIRALVGLGEEVWEGIDPVEYQRREREGHVDT